MKKKLIVVFVLCFMGVFSIFLLNTNALNKNNSTQEIPEFTASSKEKNQIFGYFMLDLYNTEIMNAIKEYYKDNKIGGYGNS